MHERDKVYALGTRRRPWGAIDNSARTMAGPGEGELDDAGRVPRQGAIDL